MKYIREDRTFIYYYAVSKLTGESHGLRFSRGTVACFRGLDHNPEALPIGYIHNLPIDPDDDLGTLYDAIMEVIGEHAEVSDLLSGRATLDQVM